MADKSKIEWTDASWTPIRARPRSGEKLVGDPGWKSGLPGGKPGWYCEHLSEGCRNCYAEGMNRRLGTGIDFLRQNRDRVEIFLDEDMLTAPLRWKKPRMIFVCSMTDLFADFVKDEWIDNVFAVMALCPQHTFQVLTKRAERMRDCLSEPLRHNSIELAAETVKRGPEWIGGMHILPRLPLKNVWLGVSAERQQEADERIPHLLETPAAVRFVSCEPLLGAIDLTKIDGGALDRGAAGITLDALRGGRLSATPWHLGWVIVGGESGCGARPMHPRWAGALRDQCAAAGVPFFFKQWGEWGRIGDQRPRVDHLPEDADVTTRVGKKAAGRLLDGVEHNEFPQVAS